MVDVSVVALSGSANSAQQFLSGWRGRERSDRFERRSLWTLRRGNRSHAACGLYPERRHSRVRLLLREGHQKPYARSRQTRLARAPHCCTSSVSASSSYSKRSLSSGASLRTTGMDKLSILSARCSWRLGGLRSQAHRVPNRICASRSPRSFQNFDPSLASAAPLRYAIFLSRVARHVPATRHNLAPIES